MILSLKAFEVAESLAKKGQHGEVKEILIQTLDVPYGHHSYSDCHKSQVKSESGEIEEALQTANIIKKPGRHINALCSLAGVLTRTRQLKEGMNIAQR